VRWLGPPPAGGDAGFDADRLWLAEDVVRVPYPRRFATTQMVVNNGTAHMVALPAAAGDVLSGVRTRSTSVGGSSGLTNSWAVLSDSAGNVLAKSADDQTEWANATTRTFMFDTPYDVVEDELLRVGIVVLAATTRPTIPASAGMNTATANLDPTPCNWSHAGLTTPAALGASFAGTSLSLSSPYYEVI
jgi:hypothetical protein